MALLLMLVMQPGCNTVSKSETAKATTPIGDSRYSSLWDMGDSKIQKTGFKALKSADNKMLAKTDYVRSTVAYNEVIQEDIVDLQEARIETPLIYADSNEHFEYQVLRGDSLWKIARTNGISMRRLMSYNGLKETDRIHPGQTLMVPGIEQQSVVMQNTVMDAPSVALNKTKPIAVVQEIPVKKEIETVLASTTQVPDEVAQVSYNTFAETVQSVEADDGVGIYDVQAGDSLYIIAMQNNTSVESIRRFNGLEKNLIKVGQRIKIPGKYKGPLTAPGQTKAFSLAFNDVPVKASDRMDGAYLQHVVQTGEFPGLIARKYNMNVADLLHLNEISNPRMLKVGTPLKVVNPDFMVNQTQVAMVDSNPSTEAVAVRMQSSDSQSEEDASVPISNFDDYPVVRVGS